MARFADRFTRPLTVRYVFALGILAILAITNFLLLRAEIVSGQAMGSIRNLSGRQRTLLNRTALLAGRLVFSSDRSVRERTREEFIPAIDSLEKAHFDLMPPPSSVSAMPVEQIRAVYDEVPWLLDSEMRNYILHLRSLVREADGDLQAGNAHFRYISNPQTIDQVLKGLDAVVDVYEQRSKVIISQLRRLANWSLVSMLVVLLLNGWFVFRPMVQRVREVVDDLNLLNESLDKRVAERAAEAEQRAADLARSQSALHNSETLYRSLVDNLPMCVIRKDIHGRFMFANDHFCQLVQRPFDQLVNCSDEDLYPAELAAKYRADDERVMETGGVLQDVERHQAPQGSATYVEVVKAPLRDATGKTIGTQTVFWDVTDRKEAEQKARHAERLTAIGQMVAGVAHESRNALQQMQACSRLLEWECDGDDSKRELIADIQAAQDRLHRLFDELREYASPLNLDVRPCSISALLMQAWANVEHYRQGRDASLIDTSDDQSVECLADPFHLEQVFRNILENALAACTDPVVIEVECGLSNGERGPVARVFIRDNGPGLTSEQQERIFEPFFTTKTQGIGLGMSIVNQIVTAHGGRIEARSGVGGGTEIVIVLPGSDRSPSVPSITEEYYA